MNENNNIDIEISIRRGDFNCQYLLNCFSHFILFPQSLIKYRKSLKEYDCFRKQKDAAFNGSMNAIHLVVQHVKDFYNSHTENNETTIKQLEEFFYKLLRVRMQTKTKI